MENQVSRKDFLIKCFGAAGMLIGGSALLAGCGSGDEAKPADTTTTTDQPKSMVAPEAGASGDCNDVTGVAPEEIKKREAVQYVEKSADPAKHCDICQLYTEPAAGSACGGCTLFKGPVAADASCISFAPKVPA